MWALSSHFPPTACLQTFPCCECNRSDQAKLAKKVEELENLVMEMEIEVSSKPELQAALEELTTTSDSISKFKKDVARFLVTTDKIDKEVVDPPALPVCIDWYMHHEVLKG